MTWTPGRPTKPGKYELSLHPDVRSSAFRSRMEVEIVPCARWLLDHSLKGAQRDERRSAGWRQKRQRKVTR